MLQTKSCGLSPIKGTENPLRVSFLAPSPILTVEPVALFDAAQLHSLASPLTRPTPGRLLREKLA
jgi:hypothetical protein